MLIFLICPMDHMSQNNFTVRNYITQSNEFYNAGEYDRSIEQAVLAFDLAQAEYNDIGMAVALQKEARALLQKNKKVKASRKSAKEKLEQSLLLLGSTAHTDLRIDIVQTLRFHAELTRNTTDEQIYKEQLLQIEENQARELMLTKKTRDLSYAVKILNTEITDLTREQLESELLIALQDNRLDSLTFQSQLDSLTLAQQDLVVAEQASELKWKESQKNLFLAMGGILLLVFVGLFLRYKETRKHNDILQVKNDLIKVEKANSEKLLLNILPSMVANELKENGSAMARKYPLATVLFSDFVNFSGISKLLSPEALVALLDEYFHEFDDITEKYGLEKIKTIGDAYMCVGGLPEKNATHPYNVILAAIEMQSLLDQMKIKKEKKDEPYFEARIGVHSGPLVAGVVGSKKFAYDIWGDTVNIASRIETGGEAGKVNISADTYALIQDQFECVSRGKLPIKNRGEIEMFFVEDQK